MTKYQPEIDYDFPFVTGLTTLLSKPLKGFTEKDISLLCKTITEEYLLPVEPVGAVKGEIGIYYLRVPERLSETQIGWIHEIICYYKRVGVQIVIVQSDEHIDDILTVLQMRFDIEKEMMTLLKDQGEVAYSDKGSSMIKDIIDKSLSNQLPSDYEVNYEGQRSFTVKYTHPAPVRWVEIKGEIDV